MHTLHILSYVITELPDVPIILLSGTIGEERAVELFKEGVDDCVNKGKLVRLVPALERSLREAHSHMARQQAEAELLPSEKRYRNLTGRAHINLRKTNKIGDYHEKSP